MESVDVTLPTCPSCGDKRLSADLSCHTWGGNGEGKGWMSCVGCSSAMRYSCSNDDCSWSYTHGLNPRNPRSKKNDENCPSWLEGKGFDSPGGCWLAEGFEWGDNHSWAGTTAYWEDFFDE